MFQTSMLVVALQVVLLLLSTTTISVSAEGGLRPLSSTGDAVLSSVSDTALPINAELTILADIAKSNSDNDVSGEINNNNNNDNSKKLSSSSVSSSTTTSTTSTIRDFLNEMDADWVRESVTILKWNSSGILENTTLPAGHGDWFENFLDNDFLYTTPSQHGKVALVFVNDCIIFVPWSTQPPVPLLVYTMPREQLNTNNFILFPNPYDESGFSQWQVDNLRNKADTTNPLIHTYDTFHERSNVLIWRGADHGERSRVDLIAIDEKEEALLLNTGDQGTTETSPRRWLDAKTSFQEKNRISEYDMATKFKYHIDVGGVSGTSWEGLRWKMCSGNLVFRVDSGYVDWWHVDIQPGVHYLNINTDYSNLREQYDWAEANPVDAYEIAKRGQQACLQSYTKEYSRNKAQRMIKSLPDATVEQMQEATVLIDEYYNKQKDKINN